MGMEQFGRAEKQGRKFLNPVPTKLGGFGLMLKILPLYLRNQEERVPQVRPGPFRTDAGVYEREAGSGLRVTWFGHSSMLVEMDGVKVLVDPVWEERASPAQWFGPRRFFAPTLDLAQMPRLDAVLISHDHYDHLGAGTVGRLAEAMPEVRWITSVGVGKVLRGFGVREGRVTELDWGESTVVAGEALGAEMRVTSVPARHFSGRAVWNRNETLWASFVLEGARHKVYFGADSGLWEGMAGIGEEYGPFDVTMLEVGAYNDLWKDIHMGPEGAAAAFRGMGGQGLLMPIHWGLFDLALHGWRWPIERMWELGVPLFSPEPGMPTEVGGVEVRSEWWRG